MVSMAAGKESATLLRFYESAGSQDFSFSRMVDLGSTGPEVDLIISATQFLGRAISHIPAYSSPHPVPKPYTRCGYCLPLGSRRQTVGGETQAPRVLMAG